MTNPIAPPKGADSLVPRFAEMSEWLGEGSSGGPIIDRETPNLLGLYLGYRAELITTDKGDGQPIGARGIMLRIDDCVDWNPESLGYRSLGDVLKVAHMTLPTG